MSHKLHLLLPKFPADTDTLPELDHLSLFASRAQKTPWHYQDHDACLFDLFGFQGQDLPVAPVTCLADGQSVDKNAIYLRADPVYLQADRDKVFLFDADNSLQDLTLDEAQQFIDALNQHFAEDGLAFFAPTPTRWYIKLETRPNVSFSSMSEVKGADIHDYMPKGEDKLKWRSYLNEIQMLLYQNPVNEQREMDRKLAVNSVWFWGMGQLPDLPKNDWSQVWGNDVLANGLAQLSDVAHESLPNQVEPILQQTGDQLVIFEKSESFLQDFDTIWLSPLLKALRKRQISEIILYTNRGIFNLSSRQLKQWWKWKKHWVDVVY
ncbi:hypothetical protein [Candidatus Albibeggiatoa sp. nov. NOAA]|uniref:hypothetical protein n=1 Tax=Candidatus Albibeggiatoa sp. nov. NOAA TaxID=3162724 RepID=UPI0032FA1061|nr:hypothetical protein [Thiotrichaceae bacterium]